MCRFRCLFVQAPFTDLFSEPKPFALETERASGKGNKGKVKLIQFSLCVSHDLFERFVCLWANLGVQSFAQVKAVTPIYVDYYGTQKDHRTCMFFRTDI